MSQPDASPLKAENRWSDCVFMKLHNAPAIPEEIPPSILTETGRPITKTSREINLKLTIRFQKQSIQVPGGQIQFGLRRGELSLRLTNGRIPLEKMGLTAPFEIEVEVEEQQEKGRESEGTVALAAGVKVKDAHKSTRKTKSKHYHVENRGTEETPVWEFQMDPILNGQLTEASLGTLEVLDNPCRVEATFVVRSQKDLELLDAVGVITAKQLSRNKTALIAREFFLRFIAPKLQPYLSRVEGAL